MAPLSDNARGALWMTASMAGFVLNDTLMKTVSHEAGVFQAIFIRGVFATAMIATLAWARGQLGYRVRGPDRGLLGLRLVGEVVGTCLFVAAFFNMALTNATAILQAAPLAITLGAALFLGDPLGWRRLSALVVGLVGVMLIIRPGTEGFTVWSFAALGTVACIALRDLATRPMSAAMPNLYIAAVSSASISGFAGLACLAEGWQPISAAGVVRLAGAGVAVFLAYYAGIVAMRVGEVAVVSPFRYANMLWALLLGFAVFGEVPSAPMLLGAGIVIATGLYTVWRERTLAPRLTLQR